MDTVTNSTVHFNVEPLDVDLYQEIMLLLPRHWDEVAPYKDMMWLNPDLDVYLKLQALGKLIVCTARADGALVGYFVVMMSPHLHYKHILVATEDIHYLLPEYRHGWTGVRLMKFSEKMADAAGCRLITGRAKAKSEHGALYKRLGYDLMDEVYTKRLGSAGE
jgi:GNAT superfamily N-acetyltransferase